MQKQPLRFTGSTRHSPTPASARRATVNATLSITELEHLAREWLYDCQFRQHSKSTLANRRLFLDKLLWFLKEHKYTQCGLSELRRFFAYLTTAHENPDGRWGSVGKCNTARKPLRPRTVKDYYGTLRSFFNWCVQEEFLELSPLTSIAPPIVRADQIQPFTMEQIRNLLQAAKTTKNPERDEIIVRLLLDSGMRSSELCSLRMRDLDLFGQRAVILGKGNKHRVTHFGSKTARAIRNYLRSESRTPDETLLQAERNQYAGQPLTPNGLRQIIEKLGQIAGIQATRCSPHTLRHTFAVEFLRAGGNVFSLKEILGHTSLHMTNRYVALAQADIEQQQRQFSPGDRL